MKWYIPSCNGDFRLESQGDACLLITVRPTALERTLLNDFLRQARKKEWTDVSEASATDQVIRLNGPMAKVAPLLVKATQPRRQTITAVSFKDGHLEVAEGSDSAALGALAERAAPSTPAAAGSLELASPAAPEPATILMEKEPAKAAVSVKRPTLCCPACVPGSVEAATEVLLAFLSPEQHDEWARERAIIVTGARSGNRYVLAHRHTPRAERQGRICFDLDDRVVVHFHDWTVPPEEEVLAAKLLLEHREDWLRNESSLFGAPRRVRMFKNPFGDHMDGTADAGMVAAAGMFLSGMTGVVP